MLDYSSMMFPETARFSGRVVHNVEQICDFHNTEIPIVSNEENDKSLLEGLAEDVIAIIHLFQGKLREIKHKIVKGSK
jgi:hypothetical protein